MTWRPRLQTLATLQAKLEEMRRARGDDSKAFLDLTYADDITTGGDYDGDNVNVVVYGV